MASVAIRHNHASQLDDLDEIGRYGADGEDLSPRGLYCLGNHVDGCDAYFALTRRGIAVEDGVRVAWRREDRSSIMAELLELLDRADPVVRSRPGLRLV